MFGEMRKKGCIRTINKISVVLPLVQAIILDIHVIISVPTGD